MSHKDVDLTRVAQNNGYSKDMREVVRLAHTFGWTGRRVGGTGGVVVESPDGEENFYVRNSTGSTNAKAAARKVARWAGKHAAESVDDVIETLDRSPFRPLCTICGVEFSSWEGYTAHAAAVHQGAKDGVVVDDVVEAAEPEAEPEIEEQIDQMSTSMATVTRTPWMATAASAGKGGRRVYESAAVEVIHEDGKEDTYGCSYEGCDYTAPAPRSVSAHYTSKHRDLPAPPGPILRDLAPGTAATQVGKWKAVSDGLERDLYEALRSRGRRRGETDSMYAKALIAHINLSREAREDDTEDDGRSGVILNQIRDLLGASQASAQVEALSAELEQAKAQAEAAKNEAQKARDTLRALAELAKDSSSEE